MRSKEIGRFYATTYGNVEYEFIVFDDATIECPQLYMICIEKAVLKPRLELIARFGNKFDIRNLGYENIKEELVKEFKIDDNLFDFLKENELITYSTDMAYLYNFKDKEGFDIKRKGGRPFKWAEKKGPVLTKQKQGQYN